MKALIVGEFSGVAKNLAVGLNKLGIQTDLISDGDGYKNVSNNTANIFTSSRIWRWSSQIYKAISNLSNKYDYVIFLSPFVFKFPLLLNNKLYEGLIGRSSNSVLLSCTSDSIWWRDYDPARGRSPHLGSLRDTKGVNHRYAMESYYKSNVALLHMVDKVVGLEPQYKFAYESHCDNVIWVPYPYAVVPRGNDSFDRNTAYHGITRRGFKGTNILLEIMEKFGPLGFDHCVTEKLNYQTFIGYLHRSVVYLDQVYSHAPAMAALTALNYVPHVITGIQPNSDNTEYFSDCSAIDVFENIDVIIATISNRDNYDEQLDKNIDFLNKHHDPETVCRMILAF